MPKVSVKVRRPVSAPIPITPPALGGVAPLEKPNFVGGSAYKRKTSHLAVNGIGLIGCENKRKMLDLEANSFDDSVFLDEIAYESSKRKKALLLGHSEFEFRAFMLSRVDLVRVKMG